MTTIDELKDERGRTSSRVYNKAPLYRRYAEFIGPVNGRPIPHRLEVIDKNARATGLLVQDVQDTLRHLKWLAYILLFGVGTLLGLALAEKNASGAEFSAKLDDQDKTTIDLGWTGAAASSLVLRSFDKDGGAILEVVTEGQVAHVVRISLVSGRLRLTVGTTGGGDPPLPPVDPPVDPPDVPETPEGFLGFTRDVHQWIVDLVDDPQKVERAAQMAPHYLAGAAGMVAVPPEWATVNAAFAAIRAKNQKVLPEGPIRDSWQVFTGRLSDKVSQWWSGTSDTPEIRHEQAAKIFEAIAAGLEAVK